MHRLSSARGVLGLAILVMAAGGSATLAQDASPTATAGHPIVGTWILDADTADAFGPSAEIIFGADGSIIQLDVGGQYGGVWEVTGPDSAAVTIHGFATDDAGAVSALTIRSNVVVAADGQSFSATYTLEFTQPDGTSSGELGTSTASGTRLTLEPMGSPVAPIPVASPCACAGSPAPSTSP